MLDWRALAAGQDLATALCGAFNAAYFLHYLAARPQETAGRRVAAIALALLNLGAGVESLFFFLVLMSLSWPQSLSPFPWAMIRALPFVGTASISLLILHRLRSS